MLPAILKAAWALAEFAPAIAGMLKGPKAEEAATTVVAAAKALTGHENADEAVASLKANPEQQLAFQAHVMDNQLAWEKLFLDDVASARDRDLRIQLAGIRNNRADVLVGLAVFGLVAIVVALVYIGAGLDDVVKGFIISVGTLLANKVGTAFDFEFGSSRSSVIKTIIGK